MNRRVRFLALPIAAVLLAICLGCATSPQAKEARFLKRGNALLDKKDYRQAVLEFASAAQLNPKNAETFYRLGLAQWGAGRIDQAYLALRRATSIDPHHAAAQARLAELMATSPDEKVKTEAKQLAQDAVTVAPENQDALYALGLAEYRLGDTADAEAQLKKTLARFPDHWLSSLALVTMYMGRKDYKSAEDVLQKAAQATPPSLEAIIALGQLYNLTGKTSQAEQEFRAALQSDPKSGLALTNLAELELQNGRKKEAEETYRRASRSGDKEAEPSYAFFLRDQGRVNEAIAEFRRLAEQDPKDRIARSRLITAYLEQNRIDDAQKVVAPVLKASPHDAAALFQRSRIEIGLRHYTEAEQDLTQILHATPDRAEAHYLLAEVHRARGAALLQKNELNEALRYNPDLWEARVALARLLAASKEPEAALALLDQAPEDQKKMPALITARNWALLEQRDSADARRGIDAGLGQAKSPELLIQDALLKIRDKDYDHARASLEASLQADPEQTSALNLLAQTYIDQKQTAAAVQKVREHAAAHRGSYPLQVFAAGWFLEHGSLTDAAAAIAAAKAADPAHSAVPDLLQAQLDLAQSGADAARNRLDGILAADDRNVGAHLLLALVEDRAGNSTEAIAHYRRVLELNPGQVVALNGLAYQLADHTTQFAEALSLAQQAKQISPNDPGIDDTLGWTLFGMGQYGQALKYLQEAEKGSPSAVIKYHLAMACFELGDFNRGQQVLLSALQANPKLPEAAKAEKVLAEALGRSR